MHNSNRGAPSWPLYRGAYTRRPPTPVAMDAGSVGGQGESKGCGKSVGKGKGASGGALQSAIPRSSLPPPFATACRGRPAAEATHAAETSPRVMHSAAEASPRVMHSAAEASPRVMHSGKGAGGSRVAPHSSSSGAGPPAVTKRGTATAMQALEAVLEIVPEDGTIPWEQLQARLVQLYPGGWGGTFGHLGSLGQFVTGNPYFVSASEVEGQVRVGRCGPHGPGVDAGALEALEGSGDGEDEFWDRYREIMQESGEVQPAIAHLEALQGAGGKRPPGPLAASGASSSAQVRGPRAQATAEEALDAILRNVPEEEAVPYHVLCERLFHQHPGGWHEAFGHLGPLAQFIKANDSLFQCQRFGKRMLVGRAGRDFKIPLQHDPDTLRELTVAALEGLYSRIPLQGIPLVQFGQLVGKWEVNERYRDLAPNLKQFLLAHPDWFRVAEYALPQHATVWRADAAPPPAKPLQSRGFRTEQELLEAVYERIPEGAGLTIAQIGDFLGPWGGNPLYASLAVSLTEFIGINPDWFVMDTDAGDDPVVVRRARRPAAAGPWKRAREDLGAPGSAKRGRVSAEVPDRPPSCADVLPRGSAC